MPKPEETVKVDYRGTLIDGTEFDKLLQARVSPRLSPWGRSSPGWTNGVAMMKVGGKAKLVCPFGGRLRRYRPPAGYPPAARLWCLRLNFAKIVKADAPDTKPASKH